MITIVGMIYKSIAYLDFMMAGINEFGINTHAVDYIIIANNASTDVIDKLTLDNINHIIYNDPIPGDYYLNRVYRAWNYGGMRASGDIIVFINSDMAFSVGWLDNLLKHLNRDTIPCSRLVESGKLSSGPHAISKDFGKHPTSFDKNSFADYCNTITEDKAYDGGLFMPCAFYKDDFIRSNGYPEGNIYTGGAGVINTKLMQSGDDYLFRVNPIISKKKHITIFDSIVYHIQEGEKDVLYSSKR